jgi:alkaline phosphatase D
VLALCAGLIASAALGQAALLVAAGDVSATTAVLWARGVRAGEVSIEVSAGGAEGRSRRVSFKARDENDFTGKARVTELAPATRYRYRVTQDAASA